MKHVCIKTDLHTQIDAPYLLFLRESEKLSDPYKEIAGDHGVCVIETIKRLFLCGPRIS